MELKKRQKSTTIFLDLPSTKFHKMNNGIVVNYRFVKCCDADINCKNSSLKKHMLNQ